MNKLQLLKNMGFRINWSLVRIGYCGEKNIPPQLTKNEVVDFASLILETARKEDYEPLAVLITGSKNKSEFIEALDTLSKSEITCSALEYKKWRVFLVKQTLEKIDTDYTSGLLQLTELWISLGLPNDSPHIVQGRNNSITPQEYYSKKTFDNIVIRHREWVEKEINNICSEEKAHSLGKVKW